MPASPKERPLVLLTGFGPFPGVPENASGVLVRRLAAAARKRFPDCAFRSAVLPTEWAAGPSRLARLLDETRPLVALHFGVSGEARGFSVETQARNVRHIMTDAAGLYPDCGEVVRGGPASAASTFPAQRIVERLRSLGLPADISNDAGVYLCNAVLYHSLCRADQHPVAGFIHIPARLIEGHVGALDWDGAVRGGLEIIAVCLDEAVGPVGKKALSTA